MRSVTFSKLESQQILYCPKFELPVLKCEFHNLVKCKQVPGCNTVLYFSLFVSGVPLNKEQCFHLFTMGADTCSLSQCDSSEMATTYHHHVTQDIVQHSGLTHDLFTGQHTINVQPLKVSQLAPKLLNPYWEILGFN